METEQPQRQSADPGAAVVLRLGVMDLDAAEVLGADIAVLAGADQPGWRPVVAVQRATVEVLRDEHVIGERVLDRDDRPPAVQQNTTRETAVAGWSAGSMMVRYTVWKETPSQRRSVTNQPVTQWSRR